MPRFTTMVLFLVTALPAAADDVEAFRQENARLRERVDVLERENARLRSLVSPAEADDLPPVAVTTDETGVSTSTATIPLAVLQGSRAAHELRLRHADGETRATIAAILSGGIYRSVDVLELEVDDAVSTLPVVDYDTTRVTAGSPQRRRRRDRERVAVTLTPALLARLADARSVGGKLGRVRFVVEARSQRTLAAFARAVTTDPPPSAAP